MSTQSFTCARCRRDFTEADSHGHCSAETHARQPDGTFQVRRESLPLCQRCAKSFWEWRDTIR
jgi:hypothetical protein